MDSFAQIDTGSVFRTAVAYFIEAMALAFIIAFLRPSNGRRFAVQELLMAAAGIAFVLFVLDTFSPNAGNFIRMGAGFGIGAAYVGFSK